jgi:hypothetical protein
VTGFKIGVAVAVRVPKRGLAAVPVVPNKGNVVVADAVVLVTEPKSELLPNIF